MLSSRLGEAHRIQQWVLLPQVACVLNITNLHEVLYWLCAQQILEWEPILLRLSCSILRSSLNI